LRVLHLGRVGGDDVLHDVPHQRLAVPVGDRPPARFDQLLFLPDLFGPLAKIGSIHRLDPQQAKGDRKNQSQDQKTDQQNAKLDGFPVSLHLDDSLHPCLSRSACSLRFFRSPEEGKGFTFSAGTMPFISANRRIRSPLLSMFFSASSCRLISWIRLTSSSTF